MGQWFAAADVMEEVMDKETIPIVSKGEQGEDVIRVPPELIIRVGEALRRKEVLPATYHQVMRCLIESTRTQGGDSTEMEK